MIVITMARKPLEGTVAVVVSKYGTGSLNIEACRISGKPEVPGSANIKPKVDVRVFSKSWADTSARRVSIYRENIPSGRWPANLILQHVSECVQVGTTRVPSSKTPSELGRRLGGFGNVGSEKGSTKPNAVTYGDSEGLEEVVLWACHSGCPALSLNEQTGRTGGSLRVTLSDEGRADEAQWRFKPVSGTLRDFGDFGPVSRYFKMVQGGDI